MESRLGAVERKISELEDSTEGFTQNTAQRDEEKNTGEREDKGTINRGSNKQPMKVLEGKWREWQRSNIQRDEKKKVFKTKTYIFRLKVYI